MFASPDINNRSDCIRLAVVRRRGGPVQTAEVAPMPRRSVDPGPRSRASDPSPRRKDLSTVRQQEVQPMRRSAGGGGGGGGGGVPQPRRCVATLFSRRSDSNEKNV